uniref:CCHC-type domain-containing protein n=1 Tax=Tanacetum cinerariifolium TaxID=118510 RepID=A0A6L2LFH3_TANCI|nr:hypothetical protein [Tanacetum cinerariifolium]
MMLLRSLPPAWNNITLIMRNKPDIETLSMDDLYNNLKVYEAETKGQSSLGSNSYNTAFLSSKNTSNINETVTDAHDIPGAVSMEQPSASSYDDDIDTDDLEEMDLKWQVAMNTMRVKKFMKRTERNLNFNGKEPVSFVMTKVKCYNCHRRGYFARECRVPRNQGNRIADNEIRVVPLETPASALVVQYGLGRYYWCYQIEEGPTDFALIAHSLDLANSSNSEDSELSDNEMPKCEIFKATSDSDVSEIDEDSNQVKIGLDDSMFKFKISETRTIVNKNESIASKSSEEIREEPKTVRSSAPIIKD